MPGHIHVSHPCISSRQIRAAGAAQYKFSLAKYNISSSTICSWNREQAEYFAREFAKESHGLNPRMRRGREGKMWIVEEATIKWFRISRARPECPVIDDTMLRCVAAM